MLIRITTGCIIEVVNLEQILRKNGLQCHYLKAKNDAVSIIWITQLCMCKILQIRHGEGAYCVCIFYHVVYHYQASRNKNCFKFRGRVLWVYHDSASFCQVNEKKTYCHKSRNRYHDKPAFSSQIATLRKVENWFSSYIVCWTD